MSDTRILVIDDDDAICRTARWAVESMAICDVAHDVHEACALLDRERYDLALVDVRLSGASGLALLDMMRVRWPGVAALMISGNDDLTVARDALDRGALAYVVKPFRVNDLRIHVAAALELARRPPTTFAASARARIEDQLDATIDRGQPALFLVVEIDQPSLLDATLGTGTLALVQRHLEERLGGTAHAELLGELRPGVLTATLLTDLSSDPATSIRALHRRLSNPVIVDERNVPSAVRIGIAATDPHTDAGTIVSRAEEAASRAQEQRVPFEFADPDRRSLARGQLELLADLKLAIDAHRLRVAYQPQVDLATGDWIGIEALVRWEHPTRGPIPPSVLVPLAERAGYMDLLGASVLRTACRDVALLTELGAPADLRFAVNVSTSQLRDPQFVARVSSVLKETRTEPTRLCLEITESLALDESAAIDARLRAIDDLGVMLSLDDFGTGYSSFSLLQRAPWREIKIDRSITATLGEPSAVAILRSVIALGAARELDVLAEGVETEEQSVTLRELGCRYAQGFWYAHPQPLGGIAEHLCPDDALPLVARLGPG
jgi:EAL domain-containing protein (putative c-di-GMP-specific phosphodiesterase class I)/ActR/RegA family two-component response regulator